MSRAPQTGGLAFSVPHTPSEINKHACIRAGKPDSESIREWNRMSARGLR